MGRWQTSTALCSRSQLSLPQANDSNASNIIGRVAEACNLMGIKVVVVRGVPRAEGFGRSSLLPCTLTLGASVGLQKLEVASPHLQPPPRALWSAPAARRALALLSPVSGWSRALCSD